MTNKILLAVFTFSLLFCFTSSAFAQEAAKKEAKKEENKELKSVTCEPMCGFMVRSHDEKELIDVVMTHSKRAHNKTMTEKDVKAMVKTEGTAEVKKEMKMEVKEEMKEKKE